MGVKMPFLSLQGLFPGFLDLTFESRDILNFFFTEYSVLYVFLLSFFWSKLFVKDSLMIFYIDF